MMPYWPQVGQSVIREELYIVAPSNNPSSSWCYLFPVILHMFPCSGHNVARMHGVFCNKYSGTKLVWLLFKSPG